MVGVHGVHGDREGRDEPLLAEVVEVGMEDQRNGRGGDVAPGLVRPTDISKLPQAAEVVVDADADVEMSLEVLDRVLLDGLRSQVAYVGLATRVYRRPHVRRIRP